MYLNRQGEYLGRCVILYLIKIKTNNNKTKYQVPIFTRFCIPFFFFFFFMFNIISQAYIVIICRYSFFLDFYYINTQFFMVFLRERRDNNFSLIYRLFTLTDDSHFHHLLILKLYYTIKIKAKMNERSTYIASRVISNKVH